jgi:hypothetical protein
VEDSSWLLGRQPGQLIETRIRKKGKGGREGGMERGQQKQSQNQTNPKKWEILHKIQISGALEDLNI